MSLSGILLGLLDVAIVVVVLLLVGAVIVWVFDMLSWSIPQNIRKLYLAIVGLIALTMIVALLLGIPRLRVIADDVDPPSIVVNYAR
jgi:hypothetical protein